MDTYSMLEEAKSQFNANAPGEMRNATMMNRFRIKYPDHELERVTGYIFFVKPDLNLIDNTGIPTEQASMIPEISDILRSKDLELAKNLKTGAGGPSPFINLLVSFAESFDVPDTSFKPRSSCETATDWKIMYGARYSESKAAGTFSVNYTDDRNLSVYKLHKLWIEYIHAASIGRIRPDPKYIYERMIDYAAAAYCFLVSEDGESIVYYAKYTGLFPTLLQDSVFNWSMEEITKKLKYTISYEYAFVDQMNPLIIKDFMHITGSAGGRSLPIYNTATGTMGPTWARSVGIEEVKEGENTFIKYKLKFYE